MMQSTLGKPVDLSDTQQIAQRTGNFIFRKIWLPKLFYDSLPYFYLAAGICAFFATLYISNWMWILPHYFLFSAACVHMSLVIFGRRRRYRRRNSLDAG